MSSTPTLDRRELLRRLSLLLGASVSAPVVSGVLAGCRPAPTGAGLRVLDDDRLSTVGALAERILPRTDTPGALDAGVDRFVDAMLDGYVRDEDREDYLAGLERLEGRARERWGAVFAACSPKEQDELVAQLDQATFGAPSADGEPSEELEEVDLRFYRLHKEMTVTGYYSSEAGQTQELRLMPLGEYRADVPIGPDDKAWA